MDMSDILKQLATPPSYPSDDFSVSTSGTTPVSMSVAPHEIPGAVSPDGSATLTVPPAPPVRPSAPQATPPSLTDVATSINKTPATNYDFFRDISSEDRAKLYQTLTAKQHSGGNLVASGAAGLGDAISNAFGNKDTHFQADVEAKAQGAKDQALGAMDTQRSQKLQDLQANTEAQGNDPNSPLSQSARTMWQKATGQKVPSGLSFAAIQKIAPPIAELAMKQMMLGLTGEKINADIQNKALERRESAAKTLAGRSIWQRMSDAASDNPGTEELERELGGGRTAAPAGNPYAAELARRQRGS